MGNGGASWRSLFDLRNRDATFRPSQVWAGFAALAERRYSEVMKVEVEKQAGSVSTLQIEVPSEEVSKEWDAIANSFARFAKIPGYRPGKAPRAVIEKRFRKEIQDELTKKLVSKSYHEAIEQEQLRVASLANIEDVQLGEDSRCGSAQPLLPRRNLNCPNTKTF